MKISGAEWKAFYGDEKYWPDGVFHDDDEILIDGVICDNMENPYALENVADSSIVEIRHGIVLKDNPNNVFGEEISTLIDYFKKWQNEQNKVIILVETTPENAEIVKSAILSAGGKVVTNA